MAAAHVAAATADAHARDLLAAVVLDADTYEARSPHLDALLARDVEFAVGGDDVVAHEVTAEGPARAARRGVFRDAVERGEHTAVDAGAGELRLGREHEHVLRGEVAEALFHQIDPHAARAHVGHAAQ